jgi:hypothetical protein
MVVNFSEQVYAQNQDTYGRPVTFTPKSSQSSGQPYVARGILDIEAMEVTALDGSIISETRVILDIREAEFTTLPLQGDLVDIPTAGGLPAEGQFEVIDTQPNGGGETTLTLRHIVQSKP